jgi:FtsH-binding integral membrane protein
MAVVVAPKKRGAHAAASGRGSWRFTYHAEILLISLASLLIEISYTRIISYKLFYYYVYLVIGLALLGVGAGGVLVAVSKRLRNAATDTILFWSFAVGAVATVAAYLIIAYIRINTLAVWLYGTSASFKSLVMLLVLCLCVFASFVPAGIISATLFSRRPKEIGGLYFADLLGAGIACAVVIYVISSLGAPATVMVAVAVMAAGAVWSARRMSPVLIGFASIVLVVGIVLSIGPGLLPSQRLDASKTAVPPGALAFSGWGSVIRVDLARAPGHPDVLNLYHDGILGASVDRWNGKKSFLTRYDFPQDPRSIPFRVLGSPPQSEAVIGAAGGHEVLTSLYYGAKHIDAVELNPVTVNLVTNTYANFDGHLAQNPAVSYINADGRSYMARTQKNYKLIWYPAPDSYAASSGALSSAYVLSESYLYTTNGLQSMLQHLTGNGIFVAQFGEVDATYDLRTSRFVATARQALANLGVSDPVGHIMVAATPTSFVDAIPLSTILVSKSAFTPADVQRFTGAVKAVPKSTALTVDGKPVTSNPVNAVVQTPNARIGSFYQSYPYDITPTTDNDPYFYHFARFGTVASNFFHSLSSADRENAVGERVLLLLLALSIIAAAAFLLLPFAVIGNVWKRLPRKGLSAVFFGGVGLGFIFFEITLMQLLNLFLGFPTYSLTITLMSLLVFTGLGALASQRVKRRTQAIPALLVVLGALTLFYLLGLTPLTNALLGAPLAARIIVSFAVMAPLGLCLGMFMPIGLGEISQLGEFPRQYVAWGWAVNGFASVVGSALATILSMTFGFDWVLFFGLACYVLAVGAWFRLSRGIEPA